MPRGKAAATVTSQSRPGRPAVRTTERRSSSTKGTSAKRRRTDGDALQTARARVQSSDLASSSTQAVHDTSITPPATDTSAIVAEVLKQLQEGGFLLKPVPSNACEPTTAAAPTSTAAAVGSLGGGEGETSLGADTLDATLASILQGQGESQPRVNTSPSYSSSAFSIPLGHQVSTKLRAKIWGREYIELAELNGDQPEPKLAVTFTHNDGSSPSVAMVSQPKIRPIATFAQWQSAFNTFVAIHAERFPNETPQMMKYAETIRELATKYAGPAWLRYDQQFRQARQTSPLNWAELHLELYVKCITLYGAAPISSPSQMHFQGTNRNQAFRRQRVCFKFNAGRRCDPSKCSFSHICENCKGRHARAACPGKPIYPTGSSPLNEPQAGKARGSGMVAAGLPRK